MFITFAPWRIISLTSLPEPSCSLGKTWTCTLLLVRWATFFAKYSAARCAGSVVESECARRIRTTSWAAAGAACSRAASDRASNGSFIGCLLEGWISSAPAGGRLVLFLEHVGELARLGGTRIEDLQLVLDDRGVARDRVRMQVGLGRQL